MLRAWQSNPVALVAAGLGVMALLLPWLELKSSRIAAGTGVQVLGLSSFWAFSLLAAWLVFARSKGALQAAALGLAVLAWGSLSGVGSAVLLREASDYARVSPSSGFWLSLLPIYLGFFWLWQTQGWRGVWPGLLALTFLPIVGAFDRLGPVIELSNERSRFGLELWNHLALAGAAWLQAALVGVPLGVLAARGRGFGWVVGLVGFLQTIPSLALFGLLLAPLAWLGQTLSLEYTLALLTIGLLVLWTVRAVGSGVVVLLALPVGTLGLLVGGVFWVQLLGPEPLRWSLAAPLAEMGVRGIGAAPAVFALTLYALLPIVVSTQAGLRSVPEGVRDAARGMGMTAWQQLRYIELPLAFPILMDGLRSAAVLSIGITTVAALISAGGLGFFVLRGVEAGAPDLVLLGALPIIALALFIDALLRFVGRQLQPKGVGL